MSIGELLNEFGYNTLEKFYVYSGTTAGFAFPLVASELFFNYAIDPEGWAGKLAVLASSIGTNLITSVGKKRLPVPFYTAFIGGAGGLLVAQISKKIRRENQRELEKIL